MGVVFDIRSFCVDDGDGVRTAVFLKGCPLRCLWCHNPEGQGITPEISFVKSKCIGCGRCKEVCCHPGHCVQCGECARVCVGARRLVGEEMTARQVINRVLSDASLGGGITLTGGEPLFQPDFAIGIARLAKENELNVAVETCGYGDTAALESLIPWVDCFLYDIKESDDARHQDYTGVSLTLIHQNLDVLAKRQAQIVLRCPIIPGFNDREEHFAHIARLADRYPTVSRVEVLPYHAMGKGKYSSLGREYLMPDINEPTRDQTEEWVKTIAATTVKTVVNGQN